GVVRCIKRVMDHAGMIGDDIDYISGHLSSTMADVLEIQNWCAALNRQQERFPYINSLKSLTGHSIGGSGSIETIAAVIQMNEGFIHASVNSEDLHPEIERLVSRNRIPMQTIGDVSLQTVIKASFGFGDVNSCLVLKNFDRPE
ncbi:MAG: beta-ketoacyl-[acyl-carrier-protein] synthase family protein, partial [Bacteroidetes bacterium]|nr:beta-ketoacyl-[acyl-carrier-protein] synthase family protein [Bacteroidota bacterium]